MKSKDMTKKLTLCGIFAALCIVFLYIGGFTVADLSLLVVCAIMTMVVLVEIRVGICRSNVNTRADSAPVKAVRPRIYHALRGLSDSKNAL